MITWSGVGVRSEFLIGRVYCWEVGETVSEGGLRRNGITVATSCRQEWLRPLLITEFIFYWCVVFVPVRFVAFHRSWASRRYPSWERGWLRRWTPTCRWTGNLDRKTVGVLQCGCYLVPKRSGTEPSRCVHFVDRVSRIWSVRTCKEGITYLEGGWSTYQSIHSPPGCIGHHGIRGNQRCRWWWRVRGSRPASGIP